ncbi:hypothetical protein NDI76_20305 [Halogeometricum sp. S1BR25-6]|uniref:Halobacterial output domain-containing protein n=1 Tax=Halogeometricum salsisoli TaxID=2950536 RepID=A0ABU2GJT5_9EURY|nr:HalOD1 output domain-containing protein [Halogeometricum sp. S1BR25-6]MDS0301082.1 hypothetical protein [Halogeometricum sp. S1BR25-6]
MEYEIEGGESVSMAVVRAVSAVEGRKPCFLRTLTDVLDPDALDALCALQYDGTSRTGGRVSFVYSGCYVTVDNGEYLTVQLLEDRLYDESDPEPTDRRVSR